MSHRIILASQSPRRKQLLADLGFEFIQRSKEVDETYPKDLGVNNVAEYLAVKKSIAYADDMEENDLLITSDTVVVLDGKILGKAANAQAAKRMLVRLSGKKHQVISGVCLTTLERSHSFSVSTSVHFKKLAEAEIDHYIKFYKPFDKAGAYGIQEWIGMIGVEKIEGSFYNVMGLPVKELYEALNSFNA